MPIIKSKKLRLGALVAVLLAAGFLAYTGNETTQLAEEKIAGRPAESELSSIAPSAGEVEEGLAKASLADEQSATVQKTDFQRIIVAGGAITEIVYAIGQQDRIIAVDTTSLYPEATNDLPKVGYVRGLSAEGLLSLKPDLILTSEEAGPPHVFKQVEAANIQVVKLADDYSQEGLLRQIRQVGSLLNAPEAAEKLADNITQKFKALAQKIAAKPTSADAKPKMLFLLQHGAGTPLVAGTGTVPDLIIRLAGAQNAAAAFEGFKPLNAEAMAQAAPDVLLVTDRSMKMSGGEEAIRALPGIAGTEAGAKAKIIALNDLLVLGFGPRLPQAATTLHQAVF